MSKMDKDLFVKSRKDKDGNTVFVVGMRNIAKVVIEEDDRGFKHKVTRPITEMFVSEFKTRKEADKEMKRLNRLQKGLK